MSNQKIRVQNMIGSAYERGFQHGSSHREAIQHYTAERVGLVQGGKWTGQKQVTRDQVLAIAEEMLPHHAAYSPEIYEEMRGMAGGAQLSMAEMVVVGGFTDFIDTVYNRFQETDLLSPELAIDDCTAFIIPDGRADGSGYFGQTWDMHDTATEFVILLDVQPSEGEGPNSLVFTTTGCVGQIGMNSHGVAVGINNILGADGQVGVTWPFVVRKVLMQDNVDDALACITEATLAGAHNYLLFDRHGKGYNVEAMSTTTHITALSDAPVIHTNHCLVSQTQALAQARTAEAQANSESRLELAQTLMDKPDISIDDLQEMTRQAPICQTSAPPMHIESCGAAIMRPKTGDFWAVWGRPAENEYEHFSV